MQKACGVPLSSMQLFSSKGGAMASLLVGKTGMPSTEGHSGIWKGRGFAGCCKAAVGDFATARLIDEQNEHGCNRLDAEQETPQENPEFPNDSAAQPFPASVHNPHSAKVLIMVNDGDSHPPRVLHTPTPPHLTFDHLITHSIESSNNNILSAFCNVADTLANSIFSPAQLPPAVDPAVQLTGNFRPVPETPPTPCPRVLGSIPPDLNGIYIRNGPNPAALHDREGYHHFDGDGMLHAVRLRDGRATFCARYVKTSRFRQELAAGRPLFPKFFGGMRGLPGVARGAVAFARAALGLIDVTEGWGLSNTSVGFFDSKVLSFSEDDMPYVVRVTEGGDLVTKGHYRFREGAGVKVNMCAHPKIDPTTGEMVAFGLNPTVVPPFCLFRASPDGVRSPDVPVPLLDVPLVHDFAITRKYVVFPDSQFVVRPLEFVKGEMAVACDKGKVARVGLLPRYGSAQEVAREGRWFEVPGVNCIHYVNAWEEGDEVVIVAPILAPPEAFLDMPATNLSCTLTLIRLNPSTGTSSHRTLCEGNFEFGTINHRFVSKKTKFAYFASGFFPFFTGVAKVDLQAPEPKQAVVGRREFGKDCYGGEPFFVPRASASCRPPRSDEEDEGYLLCFVHNEGTQASELLIMDARSPSLEVLASVALPSRVPYGFHGWFVNEEQLASQYGSQASD